MKRSTPSITEAVQNSTYSLGGFKKFDGMSKNHQGEKGFRSGGASINQENTKQLD